MIKTVFFDFDGVLTTDGNGSDLTCRNLQRLLPDYSLDTVREAYNVHHLEVLIGTMNHAEAWKDFCDVLGKEIPIKVLYDAFRDTPLNTQMFRLNSALRGRYETGIITDNGKERFETLIDAFQLKDHFDFLILSSDIGATKHDALIFDKALEAAKCQAEECVFIDNYKNNLVIPSEMGFHTFWHDHEKNDIASLVLQLQEWGMTFPEKF